MDKKTRQKRALVSFILAGILISESFFAQNGFTMTTRAAEASDLETEATVPGASEEVTQAEGGEKQTAAASEDGTEKGEETDSKGGAAKNSTEENLEGFPDGTGNAEGTSGENESIEGMTGGTGNTEDESGETPAGTDEQLTDEPDEEKQPIKITNADNAVSIDEFNMKLTDGALSTEEGYVWKPAESAAGHEFVYEMTYTIAGEYADGKKAFQIELPLHILKDREGNAADEFDCPYRNASEIAEEDGQNTDFVYEIDEEAQKAIIYNYQSMSEDGRAGFIEFSYKTTKSTLDYKDMEPSAKVEAAFTILGKADTSATKTAEVEGVRIDTQAELIYMNNLKPQYYSSWDVSWGDRPTGADDYYYLVWPIKTMVGENNTAPYDLELQDTFTDLGGSVVGYRFSGQQQFSGNPKKENLRSEGIRYDYVLTRYSKAMVEDILKTADHYNVSNQVQVTLHETDHREEAGQTISSSQNYTYQREEFTPGFGVMNGKTGNRTYYSLKELMESKTERISGMEYDAYMKVFPYPWTLKEGHTGTLEDAEKGYFGQKKVTYIFTDDTLFLQGEALDNADYNLRDVTWQPTMYGARLNADKTGFEPTQITEYQDADAVSIWVRTGEKEAEDSWQKAAVYSMRTGSYQEVDRTLVKSAQGTEIQFAEGAKGIRFTCENAYYCTFITISPRISLEGTEHVKEIIGESKRVKLENKAELKIEQGEVLRYYGTPIGEDYLEKADPKSSLEGNVIQTTNNKRKKQLYATWRVQAEEKYNDEDGEKYIGQQSGNFYILLPEGSSLVPSSVNVTASKRKLDAGEYTTEVVENYRGSGRTLLKVKILESTNAEYQVTCQTAHAYNSIVDYGKRYLLSMAYETGNGEIASGAADTGGMITDRELMRGLNPKSVGQTFIYAEKWQNLNVLLAGSTGLTKKVKSVAEDGYSYESTVHQNETYSYQIRLANDSNTNSKNVIFYDSLENYYRGAEQTEEVFPSDWKGTLTGIDVSALKKAGVQPKVYLSKIDKLNVAAHHDLEEQIQGESVWIAYEQFEQQYGLEEARAIAVDASMDAEQKEFILQKEKSLTVTVYMKAPGSEQTDKENPTAYNNIYVERTAIKEKDGDKNELYQFYHQDYTKIHYRISGDIMLKKVNAEDRSEPVQGAVYLLRGTSDYGTEYSLSRKTNQKGYFSYEKIEKGVYELLETSCTDDWLLNTEVYTVTVDKEGKVSITGLSQDQDGRYLVADRSRIYGELEFEKRNQVTGEAINGVGFLLTGTSDYGTDVSEYQESEGKNQAGKATGTVRFTNLELGTYTLTEQKTVDGYILSQEIWSVQINRQGMAILKDSAGQEAGKKEGLYQIENEPLHSIRFLKSSSYGKNIYLSGAEFLLKGISDYGNNVKKTAVSDGDGLVVIDGLESGTYVLKETKAPDNHELDTASYTVKIQKDGSFEIEGLSKTIYNGAEVYHFPNTKTAGLIKLTKIWKDNKSNTDRVIPDMTVSTEMPSENPKGYTLTLDANGGTFKNQTKQNKLLYSKAGKLIDGNYEEPVLKDKEFLGWYTKPSGGTEYLLDAESHNPVDALTKDLKLYAHYKQPIRYAVSIYGIGVDDMSDGTKGGLTFGPAMNDRYTKTFKKHTPSGGTTKKGHKYRCVHDDDWNTIIDWNKIDPYVYWECIRQGCTHSVELTKGTTTTIINRDYNTSYIKGDGTSALLSEISINWSKENVKWMPNGVPANRNGKNDGGWGSSRIRAMLNGKNTDTVTETNPYGGDYDTSDDKHKDPSIYTSKNCLLATFPQELQAAIGERKVKYDSKSDVVSSKSNTESLEYCYDKLWLLSTSELPLARVKDKYKRPMEGNVYEKFETNSSILVFNDSVTSVGTETWLRSIPYNKNNDERACIIIALTGDRDGLVSECATAAWSGVSPCFTLKR